MLSNLKLICFSILAFWCLISTTTCSYNSNQVVELKADKERTILKHQVDIAQLEAAVKTIEAKWAKAESKAYEKFAKDIQSINDLHNERMRDVSGVQQTIRETVKYLPYATAEVRENFTTATTDGLIEGTALLVEVEAIARQYDAELELCIARQPDSDPLKDGAVEEVEPDRRE